MKLTMASDTNAPTAYLRTSAWREVEALLQDAIAQREFIAIGVAGARGSGKTALLTKLALDAADSGHLPALVRMETSGNFGESLDALTSEILQLVRTKAHLSPSDDTAPRFPSAMIETIERLSSDLLMRQVSRPLDTLIELIARLDSGLPADCALIIMLDGLEPGPNERLFAELIRTLVDSHFSRVKLIVASRDLHYLDSRLGRQLTLVRLRPFSSSESYELLQRLLPERDVPDQLISELVSVAEGNPLLLWFLANEVNSNLEGLLQQLHQAPKALREAISANLANAFLEADPSSRLLLELLAVFAPTNLATLEVLSTLREEELESVTEVLIKHGYLRRIHQAGHGPRIEFSHRSLQHKIAHELVQEFKLDPSTFRFGAEEAEKDDSLYDSLVESPWLRSLPTGKKSIVIGDRGSGKSAIFRLMTNMESAAPCFDLADSEVQVLAEEHPSGFVQSMISRDSNASSAEKFRAIWLSLVAALLAKWFLETDRLPAERSKTLRTAEKLMSTLDWWDRVRTSDRRFRRIWRTIKSFGLKVSLKIGPITVEPPASASGRGSSQIDIAAFITQMDLALGEAGLRCMVLIDRIDEIYKYDRDLQEALVQGLFLAESQLGELSNVAPLLLVRTDLFEVYDIQEKNKFQSRLLHLDWAERDILTALFRRLYSNPALRAVAERLGLPTGGVGLREATALRVVFPEEVEGQQFEDWFITAMRNGRGRIAPRQVVLFLNACRDVLLRKSIEDRPLFPIFSLATVQAAMDHVSSLSHDEVVSDFRVATGLVQNCRAGRITRFRLPDIGELIDASEGTLTQQVQRLERLGFFRRIVTHDEADSLTAWFEVPPLYTRCWVGEAEVTSA